MFLLISLLLSLNSFSDSFTVFPYDNQFIRIDNQGIYKLNNNKWEYYIDHNLDFDNYEFDFIETNDKSYLISKGGGKVLLYQNDTISEIDNSHEWKSRYESDIFLKNDTIFSFGGYGYFNFKNDLLFFEINTGEWNLYKKFKTLKGRSNSLGFYNKSKNEYFFGLGKNQEGILQDLYKYDFNQKSLKQLGSVSEKLDGYIVVSNYNFPLLITKKNIFLLNFENNTIREYSNPNLIFESIERITYNRKLDQFLIIKNTSTNTKNQILLNSIDLLGINYVEKSFDNNKSNLILYLLIGFLMCTITLYKIFKKNNFINLIPLGQNLNALDKSFLKYILDNHNRSVKYVELFELIDNDLGYESRIKKLNKFIDYLNMDAKKKYKIKDDLLIIMRDINDNRMKVVRLNEKYKYTY